MSIYMSLYYYNSKHYTCMHYITMSRIYIYIYIYIIRIHHNCNYNQYHKYKHAVKYIILSVLR